MYFNKTETTSNFRFSPPEAREIRVRDRSDVSSLSLKKADYLPPQEIRKAILAIVEANFGASADQVCTEVGRYLGFKSTSAQLREVVMTEVSALASEGAVEIMEEMLSLRGRRA